ncbi:hypothetical protein KVV02_001177 [Mortierella alpina]|uniref:Uncharacterized protein n=1 Tax=Mortierella alpina TaxID=64518 RepID=A0A9P8CYK8_MORAP|nr:hypothetical protein KVV02_001177 [Mortierella alpina]
MIQTRSITDFKALDLDLAPAIRYLETLPGNASLSLEQLTSKLCWLLAVVGMFRGDDIACIDIAHTHFRMADQVAILPVALPKERRRQGRIRKFTTIQAHTNGALCPVATLREYISRLPPEDDLVPHHKDPDVLIRALVRDRRNLLREVAYYNIVETFGSILPLRWSTLIERLLCHGLRMARTSRSQEQNPRAASSASFGLVKNAVDLGLWKVRIDSKSCEEEVIRALNVDKEELKSSESLMDVFTTQSEAGFIQIIIEHVAVTTVLSDDQIKQDDDDQATSGDPEVSSTVENLPHISGTFPQDPAPIDIVGIFWDETNQVSTANSETVEGSCPRTQDEYLTAVVIPTARPMSSTEETTDSANASLLFRDPQIL